MVAFLDLCADTVRESGTGRAPSTVVGQTGREGKVVGWVVQAWIDIQRMYMDWSFLKGRWSGSLVIGQASYSAANLGIATRFGGWIGDRPGFRTVTLYDPAIGRADEGALVEATFDQWEYRFDRGVQVNARPTLYAIGPDQTLRFGSIPDNAYTARGEYRKGLQRLAADIDVPDMPDQYHDVITAKACMLLAQHDESADALTVASQRFAERIAPMQRDLLPKFGIGDRR